MPHALDADRIVSTMDRLVARIGERFPASGLLGVASTLAGVARETRTRAAALARPNRVLRLLGIIATAAGLALIAYVVTLIEVKRDAENLSGVLQGLDAAFNILIVMGAAAFFLTTLEARWKRHAALAHLHELRSIVHVIDMHQLTKDPVSLTAGARDTPSSPKRTLTPFELVRYLDYCSELLSLAAKVAALYAQSSRDPIVVDVVNDIERLTANLAQKVWQKIMIVESRAGAAQAGARDDIASGDLSTPAALALRSGHTQEQSSGGPA